MADHRSLADVADDLTNPIRVRERYEVWENRNRKIKYWEHTMPSLLDQLAAAVIPGEVYIEGGSTARSPRSIPPARIEAVSALLQIDAGAATWVLEVGLKLRPTTESNIRALVGARVDSDITAQVLRDMKRWYGWAATLSGWERIWKPDAPCPACDVKGYLRVNLTRQSATCVQRDEEATGCGEVWTPDTIGILAAHIESRPARREHDTSVLRTAAVMERRRTEAVRVNFEPRPDLPYAGA